MQDLLERVREFMGFYDDTTESRVPFSLGPMLLSAVLGLLLGLFIGWVLWPVEWENIRPTHLDVDARSQYIASIADTYVANGESPEAYDLALRRLSGMNVRQDLGLAYKYFYGELADDEYAQDLQPDRNIRLSNLDRLADALNIEPLVAVNSVDMSGIATRESVESDDAAGIPDGQADAEQLGTGQLDGGQSLDLLPGDEQNSSTADEGGSTFGQMLQLGFMCLTALAFILGGLYLLRYWWKQQALADDLDDNNASDRIGPYRDKPKAGSVGTTTDQSNEEYDDEDFDDFDEDANKEQEYEPNNAWQSNVEEINPYQPPAAQRAPDEIARNTIAPFDSESEERRYSVDSLASTTASTKQTFQSRTPQSQPAHIESSAPPQSAQPQSAQPHQQNVPSAVKERRQSAPAPTMRTSPAGVTTAAPVGVGEVLTQFTARYQRGTQQYEQQRAIVASGNMQRGDVDGLNIGEYGMGVNIKNGILQSDAENVIVLDVWLFDKTDQQGPRNQTRVLISEYVIDHDLSDAIMRDDVKAVPPIVPQKGDEFEIRGTTLRLICKVIEATYVNSGEMKGVFQSIAVDMTVVHG